MTQQDLWLLGLVAPKEDVGLYAAPFRLVGLVLAPLLIVNLVVPPLIAGLTAERRTGELQGVLRSTASAAAVPALITLGALILGAPLWLSALFGEEYSAASGILILLSLGQIVAVWTGSSAMTLLMTGRQRILVAVNGVALAASLLFEFHAYRHWGLNGVAGACASVIALQNLTTWYLAKRLVGVRTDASLSHPVETSRHLKKYVSRRLGHRRGDDAQ